MTLPQVQNLELNKISVSRTGKNRALLEEPTSPSSPETLDDQQRNVKDLERLLGAASQISPENIRYTKQDSMETTAAKGSVLISNNSSSGQDFNGLLIESRKKKQYKYSEALDPRDNRTRRNI